MHQETAAALKNQKGIDTDLLASNFLSELHNQSSDVQAMMLRMLCSHINFTSELWEKCEQVLTSHTIVQSEGSNGQLAYTDVQVSHVAEVLLVLLFSLELAFSVVGNSLVLLLFSCSKQLRSITNFFIVSLAASDLLMAVSSIPLNISQVKTGFWQFGSTVCKLGPFTMQLSVGASSLTLCCIAFDRYIAVVHPLHLSTMQSPLRAALLMAAVWLAAVGAAAPFAYYNQLLELCDGPDDTNCALYCGMPSSLNWLHWLTFTVLLLVPMLLMGVTYAIIIFKLWLRQPVGSTVISVESLRMQYKKKAIKMLFLVMVVFVSCWTPLLTFDLLAKMLRFPVSERMVTLRYALQCLALSATCCNPVIYAIMHDKFRRKFRTCCNRGRGSNRVSPNQLQPPGTSRPRSRPRPRSPVKSSTADSPKPVVSTTLGRSEEVAVITGKNLKVAHIKTTEAEKFSQKF